MWISDNKKLFFLYTYRERERESESEREREQRECPGEVSSIYSL